MPTLVERLRKDQRRAYTCRDCKREMSFLYFQLSSRPTKADPLAVLVKSRCKFCYKVKYRAARKAAVKRYYSRGGKERQAARMRNPSLRARHYEVKRIYRERRKLRMAPEEEE